MPKSGVGQMESNNPMAAMALILPAAALLVLLGAAWSDIRSFRIPNGYPMALLLLFVPLAALQIGFPEIWWHLAHFAVALAIGMLLFAIKWVGGGDAKLYAAVAIWFPLDQAPMLAMFTGLSGLVLAIVYFLRRKLASSDAQKAKAKDRRIPYGVALALGAIACWLWAIPV